jgi:hypothetical protein
MPALLFIPAAWLVKQKDPGAEWIIDAVRGDINALDEAKLRAVLVKAFGKDPTLSEARH